MSDEAAYLVDMVLPKSRYRLWTVTFPWAVRLLMARDHRLITALLPDFEFQLPTLRFNYLRSAET